MVNSSLQVVSFLEVASMVVGSWIVFCFVLWLFKHIPILLHILSNCGMFDSISFHYFPTRENVLLSKDNYLSLRFAVLLSIPVVTQNLSMLTHFVY